MTKSSFQFLGKVLWGIGAVILLAALLFVLFVRVKGRPFAVVPTIELVTPMQRYEEYQTKNRSKNQRQRIQELRTSTGPDANKELIRILEGQYVNEGNLLQAIYALGERRCADAVVPLMRVMREDTGTFFISVFGSAVEALGKIGDPAALPLLEEYYNESHKERSNSKYAKARLLNNDVKLKDAIEKIVAHNKAL